MTRITIALEEHMVQEGQSVFVGGLPENLTYATKSFILLESLILVIN